MLPRRTAPVVMFPRTGRGFRGGQRVSLLLLIVIIHLEGLERKVALMVACITS